MKKIKRLEVIFFKKLRQGNKRRHKKYGKNTSKPGQFLYRIPMSERPGYIEKRSTIGHWEGDTIIGKNHKKARTTLVERKYGFTIIEKIESKSSEEVPETIYAVMTKFKSIV